MGGSAFTALARVVGWLGAAVFAAPAFAVQIVEVPASELEERCAMEFPMPVDRVIVCRAPDGQLFVPPMLSYNEQGFIFETRELIDEFCNRREDALPVIPVSADLTPRHRARPPINSDNIACR